MVVNQAALHNLGIGFNTAYNKGFEGIKTTYDQIATTVPSNTATQEYPWLGQIPGMKEWIGEREIKKLNAYNYAIKNKTFEMTIAVPRETIEDDVYGVFTPMFSSMGEAAAQHPEELVYECLAEGFDKKCYDGKTFFAEDHKLGENSYSNRGTAKLSADSYGAARTAIMSIRGENDRPLGLVPTLLIVPPALETAARLILKAEFVDGTSNPYKDTAELLVTPQLANKPTAWYLACTNRFLKPVVYQERKKIAFQSFVKDTDANVFMQNEYLYGADGRDAAGYGFWQMCYGSTGEAVG